VTMSGARRIGPFPPCAGVGRDATPGGTVRGATTLQAPTRRLAARGALGLCLAVLGMTIMAAGCAGTGRSNGMRLLEARQYAAAAEALRAESAVQPDDPLLQRDLGVALLESGHAPEAVDILRKVRVAVPRNAGVAFQLGRACEGSGDFDGAITAYRDYVALGGGGKNEIAARLQAVTQRRIEVETRAALAREDSLAAVEIPENSVAVPDYANPARSDSLAPLARGLAAMLISDLGRVGSLRVLERARIQVLLDELGLATPAASDSLAAASLPPITSPEGVRARLETLVRPSTGQPYLGKAGTPGADQPAGARDPALRDAIQAFQSDHGLWVDGIAGRVTSTALENAWQNGPGKRATGRRAPASSAVALGTAPRLGRLLGARRFIQGSFLPLPADQIQLDANVVEAASRTSRPTGAPVNGALRDVLRLQKDLLHHILQALGIELTPDERGRLDKLPTRDFLAFLAYSRGLEMDDQGRGAEALTAYRQAVSRDPSFEAAVTAMRISEVTPSAQQTLNDRERSKLAHPTAISPDRVLQIGAATGIGPGPDTDRTGDLDPGLTDVQVISARPGATIIIVGDVPRRPR
jgi:tetratricopeptide (TPR) repeat protein